MMSELPKLEQAIESKQFVAHANSILDTELATDKVNERLFLDLGFQVSFMFTDG